MTVRNLIWVVVGSLACGTGGGSQPFEAVQDGKTDGPAVQGYYEIIAPIVAKNCLGCHSEGGIAPFKLDSYDAVASRAGKIRHVTAARVMPPFGVDNSGECNTYKAARWLTDQEIATIGAWVEGGMKLGNPANAPAASPPPERLANVSVTVKPAEAYTPNAALTDDYRCFLIDPNLATDKYLTAYSVRPGAKTLVHHVILYSLETEAAEGAAIALDNREAGPGYTCFGGPRVNNSLFLAGWAPGTPVTRYPEGTGIRMRAGRKVVMQVHYNVHEAPSADLSEIDLELRDSVDGEALMIPMGDYDLNLAPGQNYVETKSELTLMPFPARAIVHGTFPHMHKLGRKQRLEFDRDGGTTCLADVPRWDFHWQQFYFYSQPVEVLRGDRIRIKCGYDTSSRTTPVTWGEGTEDEMCLNFVYVSF